MSGRRARAARAVGHSHEQLISTLGQVAEVCRTRHAWVTQQLHATAGTGIPREIRKREAVRAKPVATQLRTEYKRGRRGGRGIGAAVVAAPVRLVTRRLTAPLRAAESMIWLLIWTVLLIWTAWYYLTPQPLKDFGAWIIPGSCAEAEVPTMTRGAMWAAHDLGDGVRQAASVEVDPRAIREAYRAGAVSLGQLYESLRLGLEGRPAPVDKAPDSTASLVSTTGCTPCPGEVVRQASATTTTTSLSDEQVATLAAQVGWPAAEIPNVVARVRAESTGNPRATDYVDGTHHGLLQLGAAERERYVPGQDAFDPAVNLRGALALWQERGWQPWRASDAAVARQEPAAVPVPPAAPVCLPATAADGEAPVGYEAMEAALRARFPDVRITSTYRPGAVTSSGRRSYHADGLAIDIEPRMEIFEWIRVAYGTQTAELIFTPAGARQINNGKPYRYTGAVVGDHVDHIHWAVDDGRRQG